ncbi:MAG: hypothetical protein NkDv07_0758 [Candidatus Improbicoccus devescovinae]|nr:MAG: hypothetical protein NkDv07_0758 [Candidatus Improbicoccus devescovinae]
MNNFLKNNKIISCIIAFVSLGNLAGAATYPVTPFGPLAAGVGPGAVPGREGGWPAQRIIDAKVQEVRSFMTSNQGHTQNQYEFLSKAIQMLAQIQSLLFRYFRTDPEAQLMWINSIGCFFFDKYLFYNPTTIKEITGRTTSTLNRYFLESDTKAINRDEREIVVEVQPEHINSFFGRNRKSWQIRKKRYSQPNYGSLIIPEQPSEETENTSPPGRETTTRPQPFPHIDPAAIGSSKPTDQETGDDGFGPPSGYESMTHSDRCYPLRWQ